MDNMDQIMYTNNRTTTANNSPAHGNSFTTV